MTVLLFLAVLFVLILVHEWGHFIVAKKTGMQVDEFGIGFPPRLWGKRFGETLYTLNLLPIGGFVKILGEDAVGADGTAASDRSFIAKPRLAQAAVLLAGVTMNILFAWLLFAVVYTVGVPTVVDSAEAGAGARLIVTDLLADSPAAEAGLSIGDEVVAVQSGEAQLTVLTPETFRAFTEAHNETGFSITFRQDEAELTATLTPREGVVPNEPERSAVGVGLGLLTTVREPIHLALYHALLTTGQALVAITIGLGGLIAGAFTGSADLSQVAGPVGIATMVGDAADFGLTSLLMFTAIISLNLAIINLLPFPALDGGRLLFVAYEAATRRAINPKWVMWLNTAGFALLLLLMAAVTFSDITKLL